MSKQKRYTRAVGASTRRRVLGFALAASTAVLGIPGLAGVAHAGGPHTGTVPRAGATVPPWEPDPSAAAPYGTLAFYDASGTQITSGSSLDQLFAYTQGSTALAPSGVNKATVEFAAPNHTQPIGNWFTSGESPATSDPDSSAAGTLATSANPVVSTQDPGDVDVNAFIGNATMDTTAGYANLIQVRVFTTESRSSNTSLPNYWDADIAYNTSGSPITVDGVSVPASGWAEVYPTASAGGPTSTTTTVTSSPAAVVAPNTQVTYTATIAPTPDGGTVNFSDGGSAISSCQNVALSGGKATCAVTYTANGSHSITATYAGDASFTGSTSSAFVEQVATPTTTTVTSTNSAPVVGEQYSLNATVSPTPDGGTVQFDSGGSAITGCSAVAVSTSTGKATCAVVPTAAGAFTMTAKYSGDTNFGSSTSGTLAQTVDKAGTTLSLNSPGSAVVTGQHVTYTANLLVTAPGAGTPTGTVAFYLNGSTTAISGCSASPVSADHATCATAPATATTQHITAVYSGDSNFDTSSATQVAQAVNPAPTTTVVRASSSPGLVGQPVSYTASVAAAAPGGGVPTGSVAFSDDSAPISACATVTLSAGAATCTVTYSAAGSHSITAVYTPATSDYTTSTSAPLAEAVVKSAGYDIVGSNGAVYSFGTPNLGGLSSIHLNAPVVATATTTDKSGYWMAASDGGVFNFGTAGFYGSMGGTPLNKPIVAIAATADAKGYWLVASDGGVFTFGDAKFYGSLGATPLNKPIVGAAATPDGKGYWLVASDGGVFDFGDAGFYGSLGATPLNKPIVAVTPGPGGLGYYLVASDGGVFTFGSARFYGSLGSTALNQPIVAVVGTTDGLGYTLVAADGGAFTFGDASFKGSVPGLGDAVTNIVAAG